MKQRFGLFFLVIIILFTIFSLESIARPRNELAKLKPVAVLSEEDQLKQSNQKILQDWFLDNVKYYNSLLNSMEIVNQGKVKLNSYNKIKAVLGAPGTNESNKYYIKFSKTVKDPNTLSPYISFSSNHITINGQNDNTCNHEGWHAILGMLSISEVYHYSLSAKESDAPNYYKGNSQPEKVEHVYIENSEALLEWLRILNQNNFEKAIITAGEQALKELKKSNPSVTEVDFSKLELETQKKLLQPVKEIYFLPNIVRARAKIYPFSKTLKDELYKHCGMTFLNPDEVEEFYTKGGLKTSDGKKIILPDGFFSGEFSYAKSTVLLKILNEISYKNVSNNLLESYVQLRPFHTADYIDGEYQAVKNVCPEKGVLTFELKEASDNVFISIDVNSSYGTKKQIKSPGGGLVGKWFSFDIGDFVKNDLQNKLQIITFDISFYLKDPYDLKQPKSYDLLISYKDKDWSQKTSKKIFQDVNKIYKFKVDPSKIEVKLTSTNTDKKYKFTLKSYKKFNEYHWIIKDKNRSEVYNSTIATNILDYEFKNPGNYEISVKPYNDKHKYVKGATLEIDVIDPRDEIEKAFKAKNWKKLFELQSKQNSQSEEYKQINKYLDELAKEFDLENKDLLEKFKTLQLENNTLSSKVIKTIENETTINRNKHNKNELTKLDECLNKLIKTKDEESKKIEADIKTIQTIINDYENTYTNAISESFFEYSTTLNQKLNFDITKPLKPYNYSAVCNIDGTEKEENEFKIKLKASKNKAKSNERVTLGVSIDNNDCPDGTFKLHWQNNAAGLGGNEGVFVASKGGTYRPTVTATCNGKELGSSSVTITVAEKTTGTIIGLEENQVYFGSKKEIKLKTDLIKEPEKNNCSDNPDNPFCVDTIHSGSIKKVKTSDNPASIYIPDPDKEYETEPPEDSTYKVLWQSNRNLEFLPQEVKGEYFSDFRTKVVFNRADNPIRIWAEVYKLTDGDYELIGDSDEIEMEVIPPIFTMNFNPTQDKASIGKEVNVKITSKPAVDDKLIDYRWVEPTNRKELDNGSISFVPKDNKTINFHVIARVPHYGDVVDDKIKDQYTTGEYIVIAELIGPKFDKDSQEWSATDKGLVTKKRKLVTGQQIIASVDVKDYLDEKRYEWSSNQGCHIDSVTISDEVTVSRNEPGECILNVIAYDKDKNRLGSDEISFNIGEQDTGSVTPPKDKDQKDQQQKDKNKEQEQKDKEQKEQQQKEAQNILKTAQEEASKGNFEEAIAAGEKAKELDPENTQIAKQVEEIKTKKEQTDIKIKEIENSLNKEDFGTAETKIKELEKAFPGSQITKNLNNQVSKTKKNFVEKTLTNSQANIKKGDLKTAIEEMEKASKLDPDNTELKELLTETKQDKQKISKLNEQFKEAMNQGDYVKADKILKEMKTISHYDPEVQSANTSLSKESFTKRAELTNELNNINKLASQGNIEQAISEAETLLSEAQKVNYGEGITADTRNLLNDLKNKKSMCDRYIAEAERLITEGYYDNAKTYLDSARAALPKYKPVLDLEAKLNEIFNKRNATLAKQKELIQQANDEIRICHYDQAADLANQAKALNPDNKDIEIATYNVNNKRTIFLQDINRARLYFDRGDIELAKQELTKHASYCSNNSAYIAVKDMIDNYYQSKNNEVTAKIAEIKALLNAREYTKVSNLAKEVRSQYSPVGQQQLDINDLESQAIKKLSNKKGALNYLNIAQTHYNQYNYEGCLKQLDILDNQYPDCWEPADEAPAQIAQLRADARAKLNRMNELVPIVKTAASDNNLNLSTLKNFYTLSEELVSLSPNNYEYRSYRDVLKRRLALAEQEAKKPPVTKSYRPVNKSFTVGHSTKLNIEYLNFWQGNQDSNGDIQFVGDDDKHVVTMMNEVLTFNSDQQRDSKINDHINNMKRSLGAIYFQASTTSFSNKSYKIINYAYVEDGNKIYESLIYFYNKDKIFEVLIASIDPSADKHTVNDLLTSIHSAIQAEDDNRNTVASSGTGKEVKISDNGNISGCGYTDTARFKITKPVIVTKLELWYNWQAGQNVVNYTLMNSFGMVKSGNMKRGSCDPYQRSWCAAIDEINKPLGIDTYTVKVSNGGYICQNSGTGGNGTVRVYTRDNLPPPSTQTSDNIFAPIAPRQPVQTQPSMCNWGGKWSTNYGSMTLQQSGIRVNGNYTHDRGKIDGMIRGNQLLGTWSEAPSYSPTADAGDFIFTLSSDCNSLTGDWRYGSSMHNKVWTKGGWKGTRAGSSSQSSPSTVVKPAHPISTPSASSNFDGYYTGDCRFYGASGNCSIKMNVKNNQITGTVSATIEGDNVSASFSGKVIPPGPQYSQASAPVEIMVHNGTLKDNTYNKSFAFTGKMTGTIYSSNKAKGDISLIISGEGGGPKGEWSVAKGSGTTSKPATTTPNTAKSKVAPRVIFVNKSGMPVHFYGTNESCSPNNKVNPGSRHIRALMAGYSNSSTRTFYAGRNGSTIAKVNVPTSSISQNGQTIYVIYDSSGKLNWNK